VCGAFKSKNFKPKNFQPKNFQTRFADFSIRWHS